MAESSAIADSTAQADSRRGTLPVLRLAALATHPIQYHAPLHRALAATPNVELTVYFAHRPSALEQGFGFGVPFAWDEDLLSGYRHVWLRNVADERRTANGTSFGDRYGDYDTPDIARIIASERLDAVLLHGWRVRSDWQAMRACRAHRIPTLVRGDSQLRDDALPKRWIKRILYPHVMRRFAACLSVGERSDAYFRYYGAAHVVRSPHFVDNRLFAERAARSMPQRAARRERWGAGASTLVLLFAGKLVARKRPLDVIRAVHGLRGVHVLIVGDGPLRAACVTLARKMGVALTCAGFLNQSAMADAYTAADVMILPSGRRETWGLAVNEAMACGRPAIVSDAVGCAPDLIVDAETGFTYPAGDVDALRSRVERFLDTPTMAATLGVRAQTHVARYTPEAAAAGIVRAALAATNRAAWP